jgi:hypothetical protein
LETSTCGRAKPSPTKAKAAIIRRCGTAYREALAGYVEETVASLSLTIDRPFSRFD